MRRFRRRQHEGSSVGGIQEDVESHQMTKPLILTEDVLHDIEQAADWYAQQGAGLGNRSARSVTTALYAIAFSPKIYGKVGHQVRASLVRSFPFVVYYRDLPLFVEVVVIIHAKRNPKDWKSRV